MAEKRGIFAGIIAMFATLGALLFTGSARAAAVKTDPVAVVPDSPAEERFPRGSSPLGLGNNNPFNLKYYAIGWVGETGYVTTPAGKFSVFDTSENGIRAGMINIHTKMTRDLANTVRKLLTVLSPAFENPLESFITFVAQRLAVSPEQPLNYTQHIMGLSRAIIQFENGQQPFSDAELHNALMRTGRT